MITLAAETICSLAFHATLAASVPSGANVTTGPTTTGGTPPPDWYVALINWGPIVLLIVVFFVFMNGSKRKQERERANLLDNLKKGDKVRLIGGEYGAVVETRDGRVLVKVDEGSNTKIWYAKEAVASVEKDATAKEDK